MKLVWSPRFTRSIRKLARRRPDTLDNVEAALRKLEADAFDPSLRTHKLSGDFDGCWACSAGYDLRIIFEFIRTNHLESAEIHLLNVGTHDMVY